MQKMTAEEVKKELTDEVRGTAIEELYKSKKITWLEKHDRAFREMYIAAAWLRMKFEAAGVETGELSCRVWDAMREMRKTGPYQAAATAWNLLVAGELSPSAKLTRAIQENRKRISAAIRNLGKPVN